MHSPVTLRLETFYYFPIVSVTICVLTLKTVAIPTVNSNFLLRRFYFVNL